MTEEHHPAGYDLAARFPDLSPLATGEGGTWYAATDDGRPVVASEEGTLADLLGDADLAARAVCVRRFQSERERAAFLAARGLPAPGLRLMSRRGAAIRSVEDWLRLAPPKGGAAHWVRGRSAYESAAAWCGGLAGPATPPEVQALLDSHPDLRGCRIAAAIPEYPIAFDDLPGEPRNADLAAVGADARGPVAITVEAKADEPFDRRVGDVLGRAVDRAAHGERTNMVQRVERLAAALLPPPTRGLPALAELRYQLLTAVAGTLAYAAQAGAARAVLVVHEFATARTRADRRDANAADLDAFVRRLSAGAVAGAPPGRLVGPFPLPVSGAQPVALYLGKASGAPGAAA